MKRLFDIVFVLALAWLWLPILAITALLVALVDGRPIFFLQQRAGRGGVPFSVIKFKTMVSRDGGEPVPTRLGQWLRRLSLDEVPQLLNVLKGDMSLVGPRPLPTIYLPRYSPEQARRHEVRPGITGWAQVHGRNALTWEDKFRYDVEYVEKHSLWMDLKILFLTIPAAFAGGDDATEFKGSVKTVAAAVITFATVFVASNSFADAVVFRPGQSEIVIAPNACDTVRIAAEEAQDFMGQILGCDVPIVTEPTPSRTALFLGPNRWADAAGVTTNGLKRDGFKIRTAANRVYVVGIDDPSINAHNNRQRGGIWFQNFEKATVFGVYDFLERFAGVRFYFPGELGTVVPKAAKIEVPPTDLVDAPANTVRRYTIYEIGCPYFEGENPTELRHPMKTINWWRTRMETEYMPCCHGQNKFRYMERFAKSHPEYFALLEDGRRHNSPKITYPGHPGQLCHTSAVWEEIYQDVKSYLSGEDASVRRIPADGTLPGTDGKVKYGWGGNCQRRDIVDVMAQDGMIKCACERCKAEWAKAPEIGWASDLMWGNVARLANRLKAEGVKGRVSMMAYSKYRRVPDFPIPDNVEVMVAERGPWTENDPPERAREFAEIRAWHDKIGRKVSLWTYLNKPSDLPDVPNCTPKAVARYFQKLAPLTYGAFLQDWSDHWLSQYLPRYVFGKVMWNPAVDVAALLDEHHRLMFGPAAPEMKRFFEEIERIYITRVAGRTIDTAIGPQSEKPSPYDLFVRIYTPEVVDALEALFKAASAKVAAGSLEARRIALIRRELFDPLARRARDYVASIDVEKGLARDRASTKPNLVPVKIEPDGKGHLVGKPPQALFAVTLREADGKSSLKPGRRYRLSYCVKLENVKPVKFNGGANTSVWAGKNFWLPSVPFSGTQDWTYQSFEFTAGDAAITKGPSLLRLRLVNATGDVWFDHVRIEELD